MKVEDMKKLIDNLRLASREGEDLYLKNLLTRAAYTIDHLLARTERAEKAVQSIAQIIEKK